MRRAGLRIYIHEHAGSDLSVDRKRHRRLMKLLDEQGPRLHATLVRLTLDHDVAADLLQELFLRLMQNPGFDKAADPAAYAWRSAINLAMEWRRRRLRAEPSVGALEQVISSVASPLDQIVRREEMSQVLDGLSHLSELGRTCFVLRLIERQPYEVIAMQVNKTPHQVRGICHAAVRQLRRLHSAEGANYRSPAHEVDHHE